MADSSAANHSLEDITIQFTSLYEKFNDFMSSKRTDGDVLIVLKEILEMLNGENGMVLVNSITNSALLLTNLQKALTDLEQFRVVSTYGALYEQDPDQLMVPFFIIPTEGETSLESYMGDDEMEDLPPDLTFGEIEKLVWRAVNASQEPDDNEGAEQKLVLSLGGKEQDSRFSLYQALLSLKWRDNKYFNLSNGVWNFNDFLSNQTITYRRFTTNTNKFVESFSDMEKYSKVVLQVLRRMHSLGIGLPEAFVNNGLDRNLSDQMKEDIWGEQSQNLPPWWIYLILSYPFLFSYQTRGKFLRLAAYYHRKPTNFLGTMANTNLVFKVKDSVSRNCILEDAIRLMDEHASNHKILEVNFNGEEGVGIGPTSEFYTMVCKEFTKCDFMWREDVSFGLFPRPMLASSIEKAKKMFVLLGKFVGKAIEDGRLLDIHFSEAFYKLILGKELSIHDIQSLEPELGKRLLEFKELVRRKKHTDSELRYNGASIKELGLSFLVPGYDEFPSEFKDAAVDSSNLNDYVSFLEDATIGSGVSRQRDAFIEGFNQVFNLGKYPTGIQTFSIFNVEEFESNLCGEREKSWSLEELRKHIVAVGYTIECAPIVNLLEILQGFDREQRRGFQQFVTGKPKLPFGGFASLNPKLTVVKDPCEDKSLPSAATCYSQLNLPLYPSKESMKEKLLYAIKEGQGAFDHR